MFALFELMIEKFYENFFGERRYEKYVIVYTYLW